MRYEDFTIEIAGDAERRHTRVLHSPGGGGSGPYAAPFGDSEAPALLRRLERAVRGSGTDRNYLPAAADGEPPLDPAEVGRRLFASLFAGQTAERFAYSRGTVAGGADRGLRLRLFLAPGAPEAALPWELLCEPRGREFLARGRHTPVVRCLDVSAPASPAAADPPLRVLVALASPAGTAGLDVDAEREKIGEAWGHQPLVEVEWLEHATLAALRDRLRRAADKVQVVHFVGHGALGATDREGVLLFETEDGRPDRVAGERLVQTLRDFPTLRLAFLNACDSAGFPRHSGGTDPYTAVAGALVAGGLPAVVAMQFPISDSAAIAFSGAFYRALAGGDPLDGAVAEGRFAIAEAHPESYEWATPVLFLRGAGSHLLHGVVAEHRVAPDVRRRIEDADVSELIEEKTRGFVGREFVFEELESFLAQADRGYFRLEGDAGIGKTALLARLVRRGDYPHHFNRRAEGVVRHEAFLSNLCSQLIARYGLDVPSLPPSALQDGALLTSMLNRVSRRLAGDRRCVLLVDALDEADPSGLSPGVNPLCLPSMLPERVYVVLSARRGKAPTRVDGPRETLALVHDSARNLADVRRLVDNHAETPGIRLYRQEKGLGREAFVDTLVARSEGNFMYLSYVLPALERGQLRELAPRELPAGLHSYYEQHWCLLQGRDEGAWLDWKLPVVEALAVAAEPIPFELVVIGSGVGDPRRVRRALKLWSPFLHVVHRPDPQGQPVAHYRIYHQSFREFLATRTDLDRTLGLMMERFLKAGGSGSGGALDPPA